MAATAWEKAAIHDCSVSSTMPAATSAVTRASSQRPARYWRSARKNRAVSRETNVPPPAPHAARHACRSSDAAAQVVRPQPEDPAAHPQVGDRGRVVGRVVEGLGQLGDPLVDAALQRAGHGQHVPVVAVGGGHPGERQGLAGQ